MTLCKCGCGQETKISQYTMRKRGWVKGQPHDYLKGHQKSRPWTQQYEERDCGYVTKCWVWMRFTDKLGYARVRVGRTHVGAHRLIYERHRGTIPDGMHLDHLCRNPSCVNPWHLEPVSCAVNVHRGKTSKLTPDEVRQIRALSASGKTQRAIASMFGVNQSQVSKIVSGKRWTLCQA